MGKNAIVLNNHDLNQYEKEVKNINKKKDLKVNRIKDRRKNNYSVNVGHDMKFTKIYYDGRNFVIYCLGYHDNKAVDINKPQLVRIPSFEGFGKHIDQNIMNLMGNRKHSFVPKGLSLIKENKDSRNLVSEIKKPMNSKLYKSNAKTHKNNDCNLSDVKSDISKTTKNSRHRYIYLETDKSRDYLPKISPSQSLSRDPLQMTKKTSKLSMFKQSVDNSQSNNADHGRLFMIASKHLDSRLNSFYFK